jgi:hypothetical protein
VGDVSLVHEDDCAAWTREYANDYELFLETVYEYDYDDRHRGYGRVRVLKFYVGVHVHVFR